MELEIEHRLTAAEDRGKSNTRRIEEIERRQDNLDDLAGAVKALAIREENVESDVKEMKGDVKSLLNKPAQKYDKLMDNILWAVIGGAIVFMLKQIGL